MELHLLVTALIAGHACMYLYALLAGQTVPGEARLRESWLLPGRPMALPVERRDLPDWNCWMDWRANFPMLAVLFATYLVLGRLLAGSRARPDGSRALSGKRYMHYSGLLFTVAMHGVGGAGLVALIAAANYLLVLALVRALSGQNAQTGQPRGMGWAMLAMWVFNIPVTSLMFWLTGEDETGAGARLLHFLPAWLSQTVSFQGIGPWFSYRFMCLRFISFGCDALWAALDPSTQASERPSGAESSADFVSRIAAESHSKDKYFGVGGAWYYSAYVTYPPLYFMGPLLSYNGFVAQVDRPCAPRPAREIASYALVIAGYAAALEASMHVLYYPGWLGSGTPLDVLLGMPLPEMAVAVHSLLNFEWTSLMVMWRVQRLVALLDGVDTYENMTRNINLVCSFQEMWRHWHVSVNKFSVRYIYVPIGGKRRPLAGVLATFVFVAFWHEVNGVGTAMHWYIWGALNCICLLFEKLVVARLRVRGRLATAALGAATYQVMQWANIPAMMAWDVSCSLGVRLLQAWTIVIPPLLYGLQGVIAAEVAAAAKPSNKEKREPSSA